MSRENRRLPDPGEPFRWVETVEGPALVCRPLERFASHLFTSRSWRLGRSLVPDDVDPWSEVARAVGVADRSLFRAHQVHGTSVVNTSLAQPDRPIADILIGDDPKLALAVQVADCVPLLIVDRQSRATAAVHAGWRGLAAAVPRLAIEALQREFGCRPANLLVAAGPSIGPCCYEVGPDVNHRFAVEFSADSLRRWFSNAPKALPRNPSLPRVGAFARPGHSFLDCWTCARDQVEGCGVPPDQIFVAELCTASHPEAFCSYRRDGVAAGRLAAAIRIAPPGP